MIEKLIIECWRHRSHALRSCRWKWFDVDRM